jgi:carbonic anhydrase
MLVGCLLCLFFASTLGADGSSFSYNPSSPLGPSRWADYYPTCGGRMQSPIDIATSSLLAYPIGPLSTTTSSTPIASSVVLDGHSVNVAVSGSGVGNLTGSSLLGDQYQLLQFHYHSPSEHTINGIPFDLEVHYVHQQKSTGLLAVVGVLYQEGEHNEGIQPLVDVLDAIDPARSTASLSVTMSPLIPTYGSGFWFYRGSLTTPPCSQTVSWFVSQTVLQLSRSQLNTIVANLDPEGYGNARPVQPLNGRNVYQHVTSFSYNPFDSNGPARWANYWPACGGLRQSPINIVTAQAKQYPLSKLQNHALGSLQQETLLHTSYTLEVEVGDGGHRRGAEEMWPTFEEELVERAAPASTAGSSPSSSLFT